METRFHRKKCKVKFNSLVWITDLVSFENLVIMRLKSKKMVQMSTRFKLGRLLDPLYIHGKSIRIPDKDPLLFGQYILVSKNQESESISKNFMGR